MVNIKDKSLHGVPTGTDKKASMQLVYTVRSEDTVLLHTGDSIMNEAPWRTIT